MRTMLAQAQQRDAAAKNDAVSALRVMAQAVWEAEQRIKDMEPAAAVRAVAHALASGNMQAMLEIEGAMSRLEEASAIRHHVATESLKAPA